MELSELIAYASDTYHIQEEHRWKDFPLFGALVHPDSGKIIALLMRQWDSDRGVQIERCDLRCGRTSIPVASLPDFTLPLRMHGPQWVGIAMERVKDPLLIHSLLDKAYAMGASSIPTLTLEARSSASSYQDTPLPKPTPLQQNHLMPRPILDMIHMFRRGDGSFRQKCDNFYRQALFMEHYEDHAPWNGDFDRMFPSYQDLNGKQLRGYFTWRTQFRKGEYVPAPNGFGLLYAFELINGIGADSVEDRLCKLQTLHDCFLSTTSSASLVQSSLRRWILETAVVQGLPPEKALLLLPADLAQRDQALATLRSPDTFSDEDVTQALFVLHRQSPDTSRVLAAFPEKGARMYANAWRYAAMHKTLFAANGFTLCFGEPSTVPWHPFSTVLYHENEKHADVSCALSPCRKYTCKGGNWEETSYHEVHFDRDAFSTFMHAAERLFRRYLGIRYRLGMETRDWPLQAVEFAMEQEKKQEKEEALRKITIDLSALKGIRDSADLTRDRLLTEEEKEETLEPASADSKNNMSAMQPSPLPVPALFPGLDEDSAFVLKGILTDKDMAAYLSEHRLMPEIIADTVNEAFYDTIGDSVLLCEEGKLSLVEDYREDLIQLLGGI